VAAFARGLASGLPQLVVLEGIPAKLDAVWGGKKRPAEPAAAPGRASAPAVPASGGPDLRAWLQDELSRVVMDFLKLDAADMSVEKILLDLGFDSIGLTTFANAINDKFQLDISPILFFEYPSVAEISKHLAAEREGDIRPFFNAATGAGAAPAAAVAAGGTGATEPAPAVAWGAAKGWNPGAATVPSAPEPVSLERRFSEDPIAIVGVAGVMPQSRDVREFWENLRDSKDMVTVIPADRWDWEEYYGDPLKEQNKSNSKWGAFMDEVDKFDPLFFGISPREAQMMDPQQRIFLETVWKAIEDSGHRVSDLAGTRTGLFVGAATNDYIDVLNSNQVVLDAYSASGNSHSVLANRVSFMLNLRGPSAPIDTACSSSLVALHRAIESIHTGSCDMAVVGGVQVMLSPGAYISFGMAGMLSGDGKCKTFDKRANGYVRGEGCGALLLKRLSAAEADGDHIYAVIRATAENHGGRVTTLTAPNPAAQTELLIEAYEKAGVDPTTVGYIECHGTGTSLGDPIEIQALSKAFSELYRRHDKPPAQAPHCGLSSVKTNIGHLETAAGAAALLKALMAIQHKQIPANLHFEELNPFINLKGTPFYVVDRLTEWPAPKGADGAPVPRRAGVSSFGFGGANAHVVLEEYVDRGRAARAEVAGPHLIVLSAKNDERLKDYARSLSVYVERHQPLLGDLAFTLQVGRDEMAERLALVVSNGDDLRAKLDNVLRGSAAVDCQRGSTRDKQAAQRLEAAGGAAAVAEALAGRDLRRLAELWVSGAKVDWSALQRGTSARRISAPTYPFARERYWCTDGMTAARPATGATEARAVLHPLVHENVSTLQEQKFRARFTGSEFFLADHAVDGQKILPGVAYLEMARVAGELATGARVRSLRNVTWERPLMVGPVATRCASRCAARSPAARPRAIAAARWPTRRTPRCRSSTTWPRSSRVAPRKCSRARNSTRSCTPRACTSARASRSSRASGPPRQSRWRFSSCRTT
jgi:acyl transferase domain-containing protein/acyl carrier protein